MKAIYLAVLAVLLLAVGCGSDLLGPKGEVGEGVGEGQIQYLPAAKSAISQTIGNTEDIRFKIYGLPTGDYYIINAARLIAGRTPDWENHIGFYDWATNQAVIRLGDGDGHADIGGYYGVRVIRGRDGQVVKEWHSIPITPGVIVFLNYYSGSEVQKLSHNVFVTANTWAIDGYLSAGEKNRLIAKWNMYARNGRVYLNSFSVNFASEISGLQNMYVKISWVEGEILPEVDTRGGFVFTLPQSVTLSEIATTVEVYADMVPEGGMLLGGDNIILDLKTGDNNAISKEDGQAISTPQAYGRSISVVDATPETLTKENEHLLVSVEIKDFSVVQTDEITGAGYYKELDPNAQFTVFNYSFAEGILDRLQADYLRMVYVDDTGNSMSVTARVQFVQSSESSGLIRANSIQFVVPVNSDLPWQRLLSSGVVQGESYGTLSLYYSATQATKITNAVLAMSIEFPNGTIAEIR